MGGVSHIFDLFTACPTITKEGEPGLYLNTRIAVFTVGVKQTDPRERGYGRPPYVGGTVTCHVAAALNTSPTHRKVTGQDAQLGHYSVGIWYSRQPCAEASSMSISGGRLPHSQL